jgi:excinuclease ABC subunit C
VLDNIKGIGPVKRNALLAHFQSVDDIKKASVDKLMEVPGISEQNARAILEYFS